MKKLIALSLSLVMSAMCLAGCTSKPAPSQVPASTSTGTASVSQAKAEPVTIKVSSWDLATQPQFQAIADAYMAKNPHVTVDLIDIPSADYQTKLDVMLNGGSELDVIWIKAGDTTAAMAEKGQLADLTEYVKRDNVDLSVYSGMGERFVLDNKVVALPASSGYYVLYYNKDIFDAAKIEYPSNDMTWKEFEDLAAKLTSGEGAEKKYGALFHTWNACVQNWGVAEGKSTIMDDDLSYFKPYYEMVLRMQNETKSCMDYATLKTGSLHYSNLFMQGGVAMMPMGTWFSATMVDKKAAGETNVNWGMVKLPHAEGVEPGYTVGSVTPIAVNSTSKNVEESWNFVNFACSEEAAKINASHGLIPSISNENTLKELATKEGMPENALEALTVKNISFDRPLHAKVGEVNQMLGEQHGLIMLGELTIDEGIAEMEKLSKEIRG
ncbi:MAG: sugar ABC transporter substrate-binding protein [Oscillospiraceae bacterium]